GQLDHSGRLPMGCYSLNVVVIPDERGIGRETLDVLVTQRGAQRKVCGGVSLVSVSDDPINALLPLPCRFLGIRRMPLVGVGLFGAGAIALRVGTLCRPYSTFSVHTQAVQRCCVSKVHQVDLVPSEVVDDGGQ